MALISVVDQMLNKKRARNYSVGNHTGCRFFVVLSVKSNISYIVFYYNVVFGTAYDNLSS